MEKRARRAQELRRRRSTKAEVAEMVASAADMIVVLFAIDWL